MDSNGEMTTINSSIMLGEHNDIPQVLCVAGEWEWPYESTNVESSYPLIGNWGRNIHKPEFWNWYSQPDHNSIFKFWNKH